MVELAGVTVMETSAAAVTVRLVLPTTPSKVAVITVVPKPVPVANPCEPLALLIEATFVALDAQVTCVVRSCVELSE